MAMASSVAKRVTFDVMSQKVTVLDASAMRCSMASAMSEVAAVLQYDEQTCQEWVLGEMS